MVCIENLQQGGSKNSGDGGHFATEADTTMDSDTDACPQRHYNQRSVPHITLGAIDASALLRRGSSPGERASTLVLSHVDRLDRD